MSSLYEILGVDRCATDAEIRKAYRAKARTVHPDKGGDADAWHAIDEAYTVLNDQDSRARYDETGQVPTSRRMIEEAARVFLVDEFARVVADGGVARDMAKLIRQGVKDAMANCRRKLKAATADVTRWEALVNRLEGGASAVINGYLQTQITAATAEMAMARDAIEMLKAAEGLAADLTDTQVVDDGSPFSGMIYRREVRMW